MQFFLTYIEQVQEGQTEKRQKGIQWCWEISSKEEVQYPSEYRTAGSIRIQFYAGPDHLISGPFEIQTLCPVTSLDRFIIKKIFFLL